MDAPPPTKSSPPLQFAVRARDNITVLNNFEGQVVFQTDLTNLRLVEYSTDGSLLAVVGNAVLLLNAETGEKVFAYDSPDVQAAVFSPMNSFLLTWERFKKPEPGQQPPNNLLVWDIKTGKQVAGFVQKSMSDNWPSIQWTQDETICGRVVTNEIQFSSSKDIGFISNRKKLPNVAKFSFSPDSNFFATFVPEKGTTPAAIAVCKYPTGDVVVQKTFFKAQTVNFFWNSTSTALVALAETDVDKTGKSYYGETNIHFLRTDGSKNESIDLGNSGPIHCCVWAPDGKIFLVTYGFMPARSTLFDIEGNKFADFGTAHRNTAKFSPNGRLLCIAGFGNLQGEMDIWDWRKLKKIGSAVAHCAAYYDWSPDSCYLLTGVLCPRIRVDNGYQLWTNDGTLIKKVDVDQLYQVAWRPASPSLFSGFVMPKPVEVAQKAKTPAAAEAKPAAAKPSVYRHPNFSGSSLPPSLHSKKEEVPQKFKKQQAAPKNHAPPLPPGAEPVLSKAALKNQKKRAKKKAGPGEKNDENEEGETEAQTEAQPQAQSEEETQDASKKIKNLQKKLKQIRQLKEQKASGKALDAAQQTKLTAEQSVVDEILALGGTVE